MGDPWEETEGPAPPYFWTKLRKNFEGPLPTHTPQTKPPPPPPLSQSRSGSGTDSIEQMPPVSLIYHPGQKLLGHFSFFTCYCVEFAASLRYTFMNVNTALNKIFAPPTLNKVEVLNVCKICKRCLTCNPAQHCSGGEGVNLNYIFLT